MITITIFGWLAPLVGSFLPSWIVSVITSECNRQQLIIMILGAWTGYSIMDAVKTYMFERRNEIFYPFRISALNWQMMLSSMKCDYQLYETEEVQGLQKRAKTALRGSRFCSIQAFYDDMEQMMMCLLGLVVYVTLMTNVHILIVLLIVLLSVINYLIYRKFYQKFIEARESYRDHQLHVEYFGGLAYEAALGKDIRLYQSHPMLKAAFQKINARGRAIVQKQEYANMMCDIWGEVLSCLRDALCYGFLIYFMIQKQMSVVEFVFYLSAAIGLSERFFGVIEVIARLNTNLTYASDYFESIEVMQTAQGTQTITAETLDIVFEYVDFEYSDSGRKILDNFNLHIHPGEKIAVVGLNGAGKTTLVKLLCGLYHPSKGRILVNGKDLELLRQIEYHKKISAVFQDTMDFSFTIGENISGLPEGEYKEDRVTQVLEVTGLTDKIRSLTKGIHTYLGKEIDKEGIRLSGGELQRLYLARALYWNPFLIILDEPTSAMDSLTEQQLYESYNELIGDRGAIFISHRLASTRFCDRILLMKNGVIIEEESHESLMALQGDYKQLYDVQSCYYKEEGRDLDEISKILAESH